LIPASHAFAQSFQDDLAAVVANRRPTDVARVKSEDAPEPFTLERPSETATVFLGFIRLYQATLSTQDSDVCNFHPSCSRFGSHVVHEVGALRGVLLTTDRLARDHGLPTLARHYRIDPVRRKFIDPVATYSALVHSNTPPVDERD
jgi:putative component of membrane protein insertase Oxa1/YidC/SpoIIIJ protein YidD